MFYCSINHVYVPSISDNEDGHGTRDAEAAGMIEASTTGSLIEGTPVLKDKAHLRMDT